jgi:pyruvate dehydrogenase E1 component alpha subunit
MERLDHEHEQAADHALHLDLLRTMLRIRCFEDGLLTLPKPGFQLLSSGEEAVAAGLCAGLASGDQLLTSGRSIGPALARGVTPAALYGELIGKRTGPCQGKAGRGHVAQPATGFFGAHAVVAGNISIAAGVALAQQQQGSDSVTICLFGDGACGAGILHETMNMAALWRLPIVFVCNNNQYSVSTRIADGVAARSLADLARPFGIPAETIDGMSVLDVLTATRRLVQRARQGEGPAFLECISYRFHQHSTSSKESRPAEEIAAWTQRCPIEAFAQTLNLPAAQLSTLRNEVEREIAAALAEAVAAPFPAPEEALLHLWAS